MRNQTTKPPFPRNGFHVEDVEKWCSENLLHPNVIKVRTEIEIYKMWRDKKAQFITSDIPFDQQRTIIEDNLKSVQVILNCIDNINRLCQET